VVAPSTEPRALALAPGREPTWCPGCGNFGVLAALRAAIEELGLAPHEVVVVSGIGCGSKLPDFLPTYGMLSIHGRPLPIATGIKLANPRLHVVVVDGDGDAYSIGGNHLLHTARRNPDITHIVQNNQLFGLTGGQHSVTSDLGFESGTSPRGVEELPLVPTALTFAAGAGYIARGLSHEPSQLARLIADGVRFPGYAHIDVLQPCVSFGNSGGAEAMELYDALRTRAYEVPGEAPDRATSARLVQEWGDRIPVGVLHREAEPRRIASGPEPGAAAGTEAHDPREPRYRALLATFR
jgi:2-oxoglutarate ferredoxin oxidoreductase subunit beta